MRRAFLEVVDDAGVLIEAVSPWLEERRRLHVGDRHFVRSECTLGRRNGTLQIHDQRMRDNHCHIRRHTVSYWLMAERGNVAIDGVVDEGELRIDAELSIPLSTGRSVRFRFGIGETEFEEWERIRFGDWLGFMHPEARGVGRCVRRSAPDAAPLGFSLFFGPNGASQVARLSRAAPFWRVIDVVEQDGGVCVVHDDVFGVPFDELVGLDSWHMRFETTASTHTHAHPSLAGALSTARLDPNIVAAVVVPIAEMLRDTSVNENTDWFDLAGSIFVALDGVVRCTKSIAVSSSIDDESAHRVDTRAERLARVVLLSLLSPSARAAGFIHGDSAPWQGLLPDSTLAVVLRAAGGADGAQSGLDELVDALVDWRRELHPTSPETLRALVAGLFPERLRAEERTREALLLLDEDAIEGWGAIVDE